MELNHIAFELLYKSHHPSHVDHVKRENCRISIKSSQHPQAALFYGQEAEVLDKQTDLTHHADANTT